MIRFACRDDVDDIMSFIDTYWKRGHILGNNKEFFLYEHSCSEGINYVISIDDKNGKINAILGYIPYGKKNRDVMTVMWKANHTAHPSLGIELFQYLKTKGDVRVLASPGSNPRLKDLYRYLGYQFGKMIQWYRLRPQPSYLIAKVSDEDIPTGKNCATYIPFLSWRDLESSFDFNGYTSETKPFKEPWYIKKRYYDHPIYSYNVFGISNAEGCISLLMIFRIINVNNVNIVRLIDCIGDYSLIAMSTNLLDDLLDYFSAEYVDCYEIGLPDSYFVDAGWKKTEESGNTIPNYFSPFVQSNIDIYYFSTAPDIVLFKGDGDQDRPN